MTFPAGAQAGTTTHHSAGPALPDAVMHLYGVSEPATGTVVSNERCTAGRKPAGFVHHIAFDISSTKLAGAFKPGQSFGVIPPGLNSRGQPHKLRLYSLSSPTRGEDGQSHVVATTVKRTIDEHHDSHQLFLGVASNYLCDLRPGDQVRLTGPAGKRFLLPAAPEQHDYVFFATGTGIAPFRGMILDLLEHRCPSRIVLVMGSPYASDLLYHADLQRLAREHPNFTYLTAISREKQADIDRNLYVQDRLDTNAAELIPLLSSPRGLVYVCGIAGMELAILQRLHRDLPPAAREGYMSVDPVAAAAPDQWERRMLHKQVKPTRRVFIEVY